MAAPIQVPITSPIKGVVRASPREGQPEGTCWDALNVLPYDRYGRKRVAQRGGLLKQYTTQIGHNNTDPAPDGFIQGMIEAPVIVYPGQPLIEPIWSLDQLAGWGAFPATGYSAPYNGPTVTVTFGKIYISFSVSLSTGNVVQQEYGSELASGGWLGVNLGTNATDNLIIGFSVSPSAIYMENMNSAAFLLAGDASLPFENSPPYNYANSGQAEPPSAWTTVADTCNVIQANPAYGGSTPTDWTSTPVSFLVTIDPSNGHCTVEANGDPSTLQTGTLPFTVTKPNPNVSAILIYSATPGGQIVGPPDVCNLNITD